MAAGGLASAATASHTAACGKCLMRLQRTILAMSEGVLSIPGAKSFLAFDMFRQSVKAKQRVLPSGLHLEPRREAQREVLLLVSLHARVLCQSCTKHARVNAVRVLSGGFCCTSASNLYKPPTA